MESEAGNPLEVEGVLNPAAVRVEPLRRYVMTYTAHSTNGRRRKLTYAWRDWTCFPSCEHECRAICRHADLIAPYKANVP